MKVKRVGMGCAIQMSIRYDPLHSNRAGRLDHRHISSGHLLLGLLDQPASPAVTVLTDAGVDIARLRDDVARRMIVAA